MPKKRKLKNRRSAKKEMCCNWNPGCKCGGGIYGLGFIGALVYYIQSAPSFWMGVLGVLKSIVWPAFLIYKLLGFLGA